ncbi:hypothetical protein BOO91_02105 [Vibrio navarrensis]|nr:hypothetical protein [Vibrio navarrensis]
MNSFDKVYFKSKAVGRLSSKSLSELKSTLTDIEIGKHKLKKEISLANQQLKELNSDLSWINWFPLKLFFRAR